MVGLASIMVCAFVWQKSCSPELRFQSLSDRRSAFHSSYRPSTNTKLRIIENLGTYGLGNPYGTFYYPAGSGEYRIWIVDNRDDTGYLVYQSWHGSHTTTDWAFPLVKKSGKERLLGTINRLVLGRGFRIKGRPTKAQLAALSVMEPFIRIDEGHVIDAGEFYVQMLSETTDTVGKEYHCIPQASYAFYEHPPIVPAEALWMGSRIKEPWIGKADYDVEPWTEGHTW